MMNKKIISSSRQINLAGRTIDYILNISPRAKRLRLAIYNDGRLVATQPRLSSLKALENFIFEKADWIIAKIDKSKDTAASPLNRLTRRDYLANREQARALVTQRLEYYNRFYNFRYGRINIRDQRTRWGSCSRRGGLNFNFRLLFLPEAVRDYVIVHELCHLKEFNHSPAFWKLVAQSLPDFRDLRKQLAGRLDF